MIWYSNLAYAIGLIATDGNLSKDGRHITMRSSDVDLLEAFNLSLRINIPLRENTSSYARKPSYRVQFSNVKLYRWLLKIGIFPAKTYTLGKIKVPNRYFRDFVRGHLDGDGSVYTYVDQYNHYKNREYTNTRVYIKFISVSEIHIKWLHDMITNLTQIRGALFCTYKTKGVPMWSIKFAKKETLKLIQWIYYKDNLPCLKRKREIAKWILETIPNEQRKVYTRI